MLFTTVQNTNLIPKSTQFIVKPGKLLSVKTKKFVRERI